MQDLDCDQQTCHHASYCLMWGIFPQKVVFISLSWQWPRRWIGLSSNQKAACSIPVPPSWVLLRKAPYPHCSRGAGCCLARPTPLWCMNGSIWGALSGLRTERRCQNAVHFPFEVGELLYSSLRSEVVIQCVMQCLIWCDKYILVGWK